MAEDKFTEYMRSLVGGNKTSSVSWVEYATNKRTRRAIQFSDVTKANIAAVTDLIGLARKLVAEERMAEAKPIMEIIDKLLKNNEKLQKVVEDALLDIKD